MTLPPCKHRHATIDPDVFACASPFVTAPYGVPRAFCAGCELADLNVYGGDGVSVRREGFPRANPAPRLPDGKARLRTCRHRLGRFNGTPPGGVPHRRLPPLTRVPP
jgi:hypothetical protein